MNKNKNQLENFINNPTIQDSFFGVQSGDSVFDLLKKKKKKSLTELLKKSKRNMINFLDSKIKILNGKNYNYKELVKSMLNSENADNVYNEKIKKEISKIKNNREEFEIKYLTIMLVGKSGVGKSTLINSILKEQLAKTGTGSFVTTVTKEYQSKARPFLKLVDTRGIELNVGFGAKEVKTETVNYITRQSRGNNLNNFVHCIWYCITGTRFQEAEKDLLNSLREAYGESKIPIIIVYTQAIDKNEIKEMEKYIRDNNIDGKFMRVLAEKKQLTNGKFLQPRGLDELLEETLNKCKEALNGEMKSLLMKNITNEIISRIKKDNSTIKNNLYETTISDFISNYIHSYNDENFIQYCIDIIGKNIQYFLNKKMNKNCSDYINNSDLINSSITQYINDYKKKINDIINPELEKYAIEFLNEQVKIQKKENSQILLNNKRRIEGFINTTKTFLFNNFNYISQIIYIESFIIKQLENVTKIFEDDLNQLTKKIIFNEDIQELIDECFLMKYTEFSEKVPNSLV